MFFTPRRAIAARDFDLIEDHLLRLSSSDRRLRFGLVATDEYIRSYLENARARKRDHWIVIENGGIIEAACHVALHENECELGLSVDSSCRGLGYAQALFERAMILVKARGINKVFMHCLSENAAMRHIATKNKMAVVSSHGESSASINIDISDTVSSLYKNEALDGIALIDTIVKTNMKVLQTIFNLK